MNKKRWNNSKNIPCYKLHGIAFKTYANDAYIDDKYEEIQLKDLVHYLMYRQNMGKTWSHHTLQERHRYSMVHTRWDMSTHKFLVLYYYTMQQNEGIQPITNPLHFLFTLS